MTFKERVERDSARQNNQPVNDNDPDIIGFNSEFFGIDNITSFAACLDLRLADGNCEGIPYSMITALKYSADAGILIKTATQNIIITGRDLVRLYQFLLMFRVRYIQANTGTDTTETGLFVEGIEIL